MDIIKRECNIKISEIIELTTKINVEDVNDPLVRLEEYRNQLKEYNSQLKKYNEIINELKTKIEKYKSIEKMIYIFDDVEFFERKLIKYIAKRTRYLAILEEEKNRDKNKKQFFSYANTESFKKKIYQLFNKVFDIEILTTIKEFECNKETQKVILWILKDICGTTNSKTSIFL